MSVTLYPSLQEALALHEALIERFGGRPGVRDMGALESALHRPQSGYYDSLSQQAAALMQSLAMPPPFVDGNKRVAFALTAVFLRMNGYRLIVSADAAEAFVIEQVIVGREEVGAIESWLAQHMSE